MVQGYLLVNEKFYQILCPVKKKSYVFLEKKWYFLCIKKWYFDISHSQQF